jgi:dihydropteroate synthase
MPAAASTGVRSRPSCSEPPVPGAPARAGVAPVIMVGGCRYDVTTRAVVMGICNRTPDSFFDRGEYFAFDRFLARVEAVVEEGAEIVDIGGVRAGPGPDVTLGEEIERVIPAIEAVVSRFDRPVSVDTWRAAVAREAFSAGAVVGNDISGFADPDYLPAAATAGATVVATHIRLQPRIPDPEPVYADVVAEVRERLRGLARRAEAAGIPPERIVLDAGLDLGKTAEQSLELLRSSTEVAGLGYPLLLSASNKTFLGAVLGLPIDERRNASLAAAAIGISRGCRVIRAHDVAGTVRVRDVLDAIMSSGG